MSNLHDEHYLYIPTGSEKLDQLLGGGLRTAALSEIFGPSGSGKTQFSLELIFNTIAPKPLGLFDNAMAIYVTTRHCFQRIKRYTDLLEKVAAAYGKTSFTANDALRKILYKEVYDLEELIFIVNHIKTMLTENQNANNIKLIVIDSFTTHLRDLNCHNQRLISFDLASILESTARKFNCAVLITRDMKMNQEYLYYERQNLRFDHLSQLRPILGATFDFRPSQRIELIKVFKDNSKNCFDKDHIRHIETFINVIVRKNLRFKVGKVNVKIDPVKGIMDVDE